MKLILLQPALWTLEADTSKTCYFLGETTALANSVLGSYVQNLQGIGQKTASQIWTVATSTSFFFLLLLRTLYNQKLGLEVMGSWVPSCGHSICGQVDSLVELEYPAPADERH